MRTRNPFEDETLTVTGAGGVTVGCWATKGAVVIEVSRNGQLVGACLTPAQAAELIDHLQATIAAVDPIWRAREKARDALVSRLIRSAASDNLP